jgi:hypothetical protein
MQIQAPGQILIEQTQIKGKGKRKLIIIITMITMIIKSCITKTIKKKNNHNCYQIRNSLNIIATEITATTIKTKNINKIIIFVNHQTTSQPLLIIINTNQSLISYS